MTAKPPRRHGPPDLPRTDRLASAESSRQHNATMPTPHLNVSRSSLTARAPYYAPLPRALGEADKHRRLSLPVWRIELHDLVPRTVLGFEILDDVVIGRSCPGCGMPDIDLAAFKGRIGAVSRRHAILLPTLHALYLLDLGSKNGTQVDSVSLLPGRAAALSKLSTITLGILTFTLKIVATPRGPLY